jgi:hypothetical protein
MRKIVSIVMALVAIGTTLTAQGAIVTVGYDLNTVVGFEAQGTAYVQSVIDNGVLPTSPIDISIADVTDGSAIFWTVVIRRNLPGELNNPITLDGVKYTQVSSDLGNVFADSGNYAGVDYDGALRRGFLKGTDGQLWTSDDVEVFEGTTIVDAIIIYGVGYHFDNSAISYFMSEIPLAVITTVTSMGGLGNGSTFGSGANSVIMNEVPEPASIAILGIATMMFIRRRR